MSVCILISVPDIRRYKTKKNVEEVVKQSFRLQTQTILKYHSPTVIIQCYPAVYLQLFIIVHTSFYSGLLSIKEPIKYNLFDLVLR